MKKFFTRLLATMLIAAPTLFTQAYGQSLAQSNYPPINTVSFTESNLPIVKITTPNQLNRETRVFGHMVVINNVDENGNPMTNYVDTEAYPNQNIECDNPIALKWRGNTSFGGTSSQTKKPISIKTLKKSATDENGDKKKLSLLGMGEDNDWALLAPWQDISYMRDILTMVMAQGGSVFAPQMRYCELVFNGKYYGVYILSERATKGESRLNLWDYGEAKDADGKKYSIDDTTGDFQVEIDRPTTSTGGYEPHYTSKYHPVYTNGTELTNKDITYQYKHPEEEDFTEENYGEVARQAVHTAIDQMEESFRTSNYTSDYPNYIDITSFIDYEIAQEVSNNIDGYRLSTPMWKYSQTHAQATGGNDKWKLALWDFNIAYGLSSINYYSPRSEIWRYTANDIMVYGNNNDAQLIPFYWYKLMNDNTYVQQLKERYTKRRKTSYSDARVNSICDSLQSLLNQGAFGRDNKAWNYHFNSWTSEIENVKDFTTTRLSWMDASWFIQSTEPEDPSGPAVPLTIADGYNMDVICEDRNNINRTVTTGSDAGIDNAHWVYYTTTVSEEGAVCDNDGLYSSANAKYYINVAGNNALNNALMMKQSNNVKSGKLTLKSPAKLKKLYVTGTSADGASNVDVTVNYSDGSSSSSVNFYLPDWVNTGATIVVSGLGRMDLNGNLSTNNHFSIFEIGISTDATKEVESVSFSRTSGKSTAIFSISGVYATTDFQLAGTTFWKDNSWNTICLPFDVADIEETPLAGAIVKTLESSDFKDGALSLTFTSGKLTSLEAGVPYIMKWEVDNEDKDYDPTFEGVVVKGEEKPAVTEYVDYIGSYKDIKLEGGDYTSLYLGANNTLYYPAEGHDITINPYHAYFQLKKGITAGDGSGAKNIRAINIDFNDDPQGIQTIVAPTNELIDYWYTLDGRRLDEKPTARGIYLHQGRRVMIK